jgi:hypothetical protein
MSYNLVINSTHVQKSLNNQYKYDCINGSFEIPENSEIMMTSLQIAYSWYYIPDGVYTTTSVNAYIQKPCTDNGLCLSEDSTPKYVYYLYKVLVTPTK